MGTLARLDGVANPLMMGFASSVTRVRPFVEANGAIAKPDTLRELASSNGYLFLRNVVPRAKVNLLRSEVLAQCARREWLDDRAPRSRAIARAGAANRATRDELLALQGDIQILPVFSELRREPAILSVLEAVFGAPPVAGCGDVCRLAFPADLERTTRPHQDHFYTRGSTSLWTAWIPLGNCPATLGGLAVLPGSHVDGLLAHDGGEGEGRFIELADDAPWAGADFRAGDVLLFNALTVHGARPNLTRNRIRISADYRYRPPAGLPDHVSR
jgi:ectoine hydroxylase-related dioxygenase (phytanoyl-CoA dioxygenase family)